MILYLNKAFGYFSFHGTNVLGQVGLPNYPEQTCYGKPNTPGPPVFGDGYPQQEASLWISETHNMLDNHNKFNSRNFCNLKRTMLARIKADCPLLASENGMEMWSYGDLMMQNKLKSESSNR